MQTAIEKHNPRETALERFKRESASLFTGLTRMLVLAMVLTPLLLAAILTVDLPLYWFDRFVGDAIASRPSNWLSVGGLLMSLAPLLGILFARKYGGDEASRVITASWGLAALAVFAELSYLAPSLEDGDLPGVRFTVVFTASAMAAQYLTVSFYDIARGGGRWWRAPLFGALAGYALYAVIYFPGVYWATGAPWLNWMIGDMAIKALIAICFLGGYWMLRRILRPSGGYGGR